MTRGPFISLDGLDGTGKSTQCRLLADWLRDRGRAVTQCADPGGTALGDVIRDLLLHRRYEMVLPCEALLFMASRAQLTAEVIRPALAAGRVVLSDRYLLANVVYQGHAGGLDPEQLWRIGLFATAGLEPDLTLVLDMPPEGAVVRRTHAADRVESRDAAFHARVRAGFLAECARRPDRLRVVDASRPIEAVQEVIRREVAPLLERPGEPDESNREIPITSRPRVAHLFSSDGSGCRGGPGSPQRQQGERVRPQPGSPQRQQGEREAPPARQPAAPARGAGGAPSPAARSASKGSGGARCRVDGPCLRCGLPEHGKGTTYREVSRVLATSARP